MSKSVDPPAVLTQQNLAAEMIRQDIWRPVNRGDDWRVIAVVGREGSGKSLTLASILQAADPTFSADHVHFEPVPFLRDVSEELEEPGQALMSDETGVGFGNRTWHDREQVESNQALQTARDFNRIVGLTAPRFEEIDSQLRGRVHLLLETVKKKDGKWVEVKWKRLSPSRTGHGKIYQEYPRKPVNGRRRKIDRVRIGPPSDDFIESYQRKKARFQEELFERVIDRQLEDQEEDDGPNFESPQRIVDHILTTQEVSEFFKEWQGDIMPDKGTIKYEYEIGDRVADTVASGLEKEVDTDELDL